MNINIANGIPPIDWTDVDDHKVLFYDLATKSLKFTANYTCYDNVLSVYAGADVIEGVRYPTIAAAQAYALTQSPSSSNVFCILVYGNNSEDIEVQSYIVIKGSKSGTRLSGQITSSGNWLDHLDIFEFVIEDCYITDLDVSSGKSLTLMGCMIETSTPSSGDLALVHCGIKGTADFSSLTMIYIFNSYFLGLGTSIALPATTYSYGANFAGISVTVTLNGGEFYNCFIDGISLGAGTYKFEGGRLSSLTVSASRTVTAANLYIDTLIINGGTLTSRGVNAGSLSFTSGTWNNYGGVYGSNFMAGAAQFTGDVSLSSGKVLKINSTQVVSARGAAVADAAGGATIDAEARTAINTLLARLRSHGLIAI
jgi:hypothetical protein